MKYQEFKFDADGEHIGGKSPYEFFYILNQVVFDYSSMSEYFDLTVKSISKTDTSVSYEITIKLKNSYRFKKIAITSLEDTKISVDIVTKYNFYDANGAAVHSEALNETAYLIFESVEELKSGKTVRFESVYTDTELEEYARANTTFDFDFGRQQEGSVSMFTKIENN